MPSVKNDITKRWPAIKTYLKDNAEKARTSGRSRKDTHSINEARIRTKRAGHYTTEAIANALLAMTELERAICIATKAELNVPKVEETLAESQAKH